MNADDLAKILDELGKRLGPTGEHVFELAVRQVYIEALGGTILFVLSLIATVIVCPILYWYAKNDPRSYGDRGIGASFGGGGLVILTVVLFANFLLYDLPRWLNPEYAALQSILGAVRP